MSLKKCSLCSKSSEVEGPALIYFGEWLTKKELTVHYYCLLLSTHLPQKGEDNSGILGFLLRDIRHEIVMAKQRKCKYCSEPCATIRCCKCKEYFHLTCGHTSKCLSQFVGEFKSYCHACAPVDPLQLELFSRKSTQASKLCYICAQVLGPFPKRWIYAKCCGNGFTHSKCMKIYALSAGYYLTCIWCKDKNFREDVKYQGVFVPDRDANWEREKDAFRDLHRVRRRCDMEVCHCPKGRDYTNAYKWPLITCKFCGGFSAHNPLCIPGFENSKEKINEFKCDVCSVTEQTVYNKTMPISVHDIIDTSLFINKDCTNMPGSTQNITQSMNLDESSFESTTSQSTVINTNLVHNNLNSNVAAAAPLENDSQGNTVQIASSVYTLTQSQELKSSEALPVSDGADDEDDYDSDDSIVVDMLVDKLLDIFEGN